MIPPYRRNSAESFIKIIDRQVRKRLIVILLVNNKGDVLEKSMEKVDSNVRM